MREHFQKVTTNAFKKKPMLRQKHHDTIKKQAWWPHSQKLAKNKGVSKQPSQSEHQLAMNQPSCHDLLPTKVAEEVVAISSDEALWSITSVLAERLPYINYLDPTVLPESSRTEPSSKGSFTVGNLLLLMPSVSSLFL